MPSISSLLRLSFLMLMLPAAVCRADDAPAPLPFTEHAVTLSVAGGTLYGTELMPQAQGPVPLVLLHAGSGPTDRDGNSAMLPGPNNSLRLLAEGLARNGVASVRYDKRLIGASVSPAWTEPQLRFDDYVSDAAAWLAQLRHDPRFSRIVLAGHSEGALITMLASRQGAADGYVSIAGIAESADVLLAEQLKPKLPPALFEQNQRILAQLKQGQLASDVPAALDMLYRPAVQPYLMSWMKYVPREVIATLTLPVLIVQGNADIQVSSDNAQTLAAAAPGARLLMIAGMNHVLKMVGADQALQMRSYSSPDLPVSPQLIMALSDFAKQPGRQH